MATINHDRPYLQYLDNIKRVIAELDAWHKPKKNLDNSKREGVAKLKSISSKAYRSSKVKYISGADVNVHNLACSILSHVHLYREVSLCNKLIKSLKGFRQKAMITWFCDFGEVTALNPISKKLGTELFFRKNHGTNQIAAAANPYWSKTWGMD
jgi:hypothetical protein